MTCLSIKDLPLQGKRVLIRVDFNVPLDKSGQITDDARIVASLPTLRYVLEKGGKPILMSHLGRPKGKPDSSLSLAPCAKHLSELLNVPVQLAPDCIGSVVEKMAQNLKSGEILLLENLRFHPAEEKPELDPSFAASLAKLGDVYVNDAFGTAHRAHSSIVPLAKAFPKKAAAGFLLEKEILFLGKTVLHPKRPLAALIGGAKVSTKMGLLFSLLSKVDQLFIGGGMAFTFLKAQGISIGNSLYESDLLNEALEVMKQAEKQKITFSLPLDILTAKECSENSPTQLVDLQSQGIREGWMGVDIGPKTVAHWSALLQKAQTILWNGPFGVFEIAPFSYGTEAMARYLASLKATTIVGGGDSLAAVKKAGVADQFTHLCTGGGASLEYLEYGHLPGLEALTQIEEG